MDEILTPLAVKAPTTAGPITPQVFDIALVIPNRVPRTKISSQEKKLISFHVLFYSI